MPRTDESLEPAEILFGVLFVLMVCLPMLLAALLE